MTTTADFVLARRHPKKSKMLQMSKNVSCSNVHAFLQCERACHVGKSHFKIICQVLVCLIYSAVSPSLRLSFAKMKAQLITTLFAKSTSPLAKPFFLARFLVCVKSFVSLVFRVVGLQFNSVPERNMPEIPAETRRFDLVNTKKLARNKSSISRIYQSKKAPNQDFLRNST